MNYSHTNVADYLLNGKDAARIALCSTNEEYTYGQLRSATAQIASYLAELGCRKGDRAVLISDNSLFWVATYMGILRSGLVCVPLPSNISGADLGHVLNVTEARLCFAQNRVATKHQTLLGGLHLMTDRDIPKVAGALSQTSFSEYDSETVDGRDAYCRASLDDLAALMFTSGSTGTPRGVMVSHRNILANTESIIDYLGLTRDDRIMTVLPFHYCFGTSLLHTHLRVGASLELDSRFMYPEIILQRMQETECTGFAGVPSHFQILLRTSSLRRKTFPHLRYVQQAGGHLAPTFIRELREALPRTDVFVMYGQTEATARLSYLPPEFLDSKLGSIGRGIPGVVLRVLNDSGQDVRPGEIGEIVAEGENIAQGYWQAPEESARSFRGGRLYTGDLATVDEEGFVYVVDRAKDFLKCGGRRVSCKQIEDLLLQCDEFVEAAVVPIPDDVLGEAVKAFVVPCNTQSNGLEERLRTFCKTHLPLPFIPKEIVLMRTLPKNTFGKVLKQNLKSLATTADTLVNTAS